MKKFKGIKKVAGSTKELNGFNGRVQINYDPSDDTVWEDYFPDVNSWEEYHDRRIISFFTRQPMTMEEIKSEIQIEIADRKQYQHEMELEDKNQRKVSEED